MNELAKFRAKVDQSKSWIYRQPFHIRGTWYMYNSLWDKVRIDHRTLGQFIGLTDKNHKEIYEGDICEHRYKGRSYKSVVRRNHWNWYLEFLNQDDCFEIANYAFGDRADLQVIGNIHDNPKLLEVPE